MTNNNSPKLVLFGSFTEEETKKILSLPVESKKPPPPPPEKLCLQFGSLDFHSASSVNALVSKPKPNGSLGTESSCSSNHISTASGPIRKNNESKKDSVAHSNGTMTNCYPARNAFAANGMANGSSRAASVSTGLVRKTESAGQSSSEDVTSLQTKTSLENEINLSSRMNVVELGDFQRKNIQNSLSCEAEVVKSLLPRGLINSGNLCFLNATLQALLSCPPFVALLQKLGSHNVPKTGYPTINAFAKFISGFLMPDNPSSSPKKNAQLKTGTPFSPVMFEAVLQKFTPDVPASISGRPRQEDAQEFLSFVMDQMHDELLKLEGHLSSTNGTATMVSSAEDDDGWETVGPKNKSAITRTQSFVPSELSDIFGGQLRSVVKARGNKASATVQPFLLLHLDIFPDEVHSIEDALHLFSAHEALEGYKAPSGKSVAVSASKSIKIQKISKILILHLMRFSYGSNGSTKLHKPVHFPLQLTLGRELLVSPSSEGRKYELVATVTHHGRDPSKGHYTADARYSDGTWLRYDDASVSHVTPNKVLQEQAYVLFYRQM